MGLSILSSIGSGFPVLSTILSVVCISSDDSGVSHLVSFSVFFDFVENFRWLALNGFMNLACR